MTDTNINKKEVEERHIRPKEDGGSVSVSASVYDGRLHCGSSIRHYLSGGGELLFWAVFCWGVGILFSCVVGPILFEGLKGAETERGAGFNPVRSILWHLNRPGLFYVNPFVTAVNPAAQPAGALQSSSDPGTAALQAAGQVMTSGKKFR